MSETQEHGVLHHKIGFNDRVYLVEQIDDLLALKQDKLVAGPGISILPDGTIQLAELPRNITYVGDTDYSVDISGQTIYFILRAFRDGICISKLGVF